MLRTLARRFAIRSLDVVVEKGKGSAHGPVRAAASALDRARGLVGLDQVEREAPLPDWEAKHPEQPMWESDRRKLEKHRIDKGIVPAPEDSEPEVVPVVKLYFKRGCPSCRAAMELLRERDIEFQDIDVSDDESTRSWLKLITKQGTTPQIFIHDQPIGGFDALRELDQSGQLGERIAAPPPAEAGDELDEPVARPEELSIDELRAELEDGRDVLILDVRKRHELEAGMLANAVHIPLHELPSRHDELDRGGTWVAYCAAGKRSITARKILCDAGFGSVSSLRGGFREWAAGNHEVVRWGQTSPRAHKVVKLPVIHPEHSPFESLDDSWQGEGLDETLEGEALVDRVKEVLDECRPMVQADGGDITLLDVQQNVVHLELTGNCVGCPSSQATLRQGIERRLKGRIPQIERIESPQLQPQ